MAWDAYAMQEYYAPAVSAIWRGNPKRKPALGFDEASAKAIKGRVQAMLDAKAAWTAASDDQRDEWAAAVNLPVTEVLKEWPDLDKRLQNYLIKLQPRHRNAPKRAATRRRNPAKATPSAVVRQLLARLRSEGIVADSTADLRWAASEGAHELYSALVGMDKDFRAVIAEMKAEMRREDRAGRRAYAVEIRGWEAGLKHIRSAIHQVDRSLR